MLGVKQILISCPITRKVAAAKVGKALGLPDNMVFRQPFSGPGLDVRCLGAITATVWRLCARATPFSGSRFIKFVSNGQV